MKHNRKLVTLLVIFLSITILVAGTATAVKPSKNSVIDQIWTAINNLQKQVTNLQSAVSSLQAQVTNLFTAVTGLNTRLTAIENSLKDINSLSAKPDYDSGWVDITDLKGKYFDITHNLGTDNIRVEINGKTTPDGSIHQRTGLSYRYNSSNDLTFKNTYSNLNQYIATGIQTNDGYLLFAYPNATYRYSTPTSPVLIIKTDFSGNILWQKTDSAYNGTTTNIIQSQDGNYIILGSTTNGTHHLEPKIMKVDPDGNIIWCQVFKNEGFYEDILSAVETLNGDLILCGYVYNFPSLNGTIFRTDSQGNLQWKIKYPSIRVFHNIQKCNDGNYLLLGPSYNASNYSSVTTLLKIDQNGQMVFSKTYENISYTNTQMYKMENGFKVISRTSIFNIDQDGNILSQTKLDCQAISYFNQIESDNGFMVVASKDAGYVNITPSSTTSRSNLCFIKLDANLNPLWECVVDFGTNTTLSSINSMLVYPTNDCGYTMFGNYRFYSGSNGNYSDYVFSVGIPCFGELGLVRTGTSLNSITLYRGADDPFWNYVRVQVWKTD